MISNPGENAATNAQEEPRELTTAEAELYDRQIRLWGLEAQRRLAASAILLAGDVTGLLAHEIGKNLVLQGVARLKLAPCGAASPGGFLGTGLGELVESLKDMNPLVDVTAAAEGEDPVVGIESFGVVCALGMPPSAERELGEKCRAAGVNFFAGTVAGTVGWIFVDLGVKYMYKVPPRSEEKQTEEGSDSFIGFADALDADWGREPKIGECGWHVAYCVREFQAQVGRMPGKEPDADVDTMLGIYKKLCAVKHNDRTNPELVAAVARTASEVLPPISAILGGIWGREIIKVVSGLDIPFNNFVFFNLATGDMTVEKICALSQ